MPAAKWRASPTRSASRRPTCATSRASIVSPGLIDLHTHVYWGGTSIGVDAATVAQRGGTTTLVDAGSAGPGNFLGFRYHVIEPSPVRILAYLNISFPGIFAFSAPVMVGECTDMRLLDANECVRVINEHRDLIVGVKVRVGRIASGSNGVAPLDMAIEVAEEVGLPVMAHLDNPPPSRKDVLSRLRPGDVLTHCFKPFPNAPIRSDGEIWEEVALARERGVIFDIGHGRASFGFRVAQGMLAKGFVPDVISSDVHVLNIDGPVFDLMATLSKFYCLGVDLPSLLRTATSAPGGGAAPDRSRHPAGRGDRRRHGLRDRERQFRICRRARRHPAGRISPRLPGHRPQWDVVADRRRKCRTLNSWAARRRTAPESCSCTRIISTPTPASIGQKLEPIWSGASEALFFNLNGHTYQRPRPLVPALEVLWKERAVELLDALRYRRRRGRQMAIVWCHRRPSATGPARSRRRRTSIMAAANS